MSSPAILRLIVFTALLWLIKSCNSDTKSVTFKIMPESLPDTSQVYVSGNDILLGEWNPAAVTLMKFPDGSWRKTFYFPAGTHLEYKFTRGSWHTEAVDSLGSVPSNYILNVEEDTTISVRVAGWKDAHFQLIDQNYRTLPDREHTAVMGSSMGGLISFLSAWYHPDIFYQAGCVSPAFLYQNYRSVRVVEEYRGPDKNLRIYMDNGAIGLEDTLTIGSERMLKALQQQGFRLNENLQWYFDETGDHSERAWGRRVWRPLLFMFGKD